MVIGKSGDGSQRAEQSQAERLLDLVAQHVDTKRDSIRKYEEFATDQRLGADIRFLISMIIADELRHHRYLRALTAALRNEVKLQAMEDSLPAMTWHMDQVKRDECLVATEELIAIERADLKELHRLRRELRPSSGVTLWDIVVSWMESDTQKHLDVLAFLKKHLKVLTPQSCGRGWKNSE